MSFCFNVLNINDAIEALRANAVQQIALLSSLMRAPLALTDAQALAVALVSNTSLEALSLRHQRHILILIRYYSLLHYFIRCRTF